MVIFCYDLSDAAGSVDCRVLASKEQWVELVGSFSLTSVPKCIVFFLEGPSPGVDLLIDSVAVSSSILERHKVNF